jgi:hypothetical protein
MNEEKFKQFLYEMKGLQDKYGIYVSSTYEEQIDYTWKEESYISGVQSFLLFSDKDGNELVYDEKLFSESWEEEML